MDRVAYENMTCNGKNSLANKPDFVSMTTKSEMNNQMGGYYLERQNKNNGKLYSMQGQDCH